MKILYTFLCLLFSFQLMAQPANDNCADAIPIGTVSNEDFSNIGATTDGPLHLNSPCPGSGVPELDSLYNDIWYLYNAEFSGLTSFSLCGNADFDTKIAVYNAGASCPVTDDDLLNCNEDGANCIGATSELVFTAAEGESYLLRIGGFGTESPGEEGMGTFVVEQFTPVVANDFCIDAISLSVGLGQEANNAGATTDGPSHDPNNPCFQFGDDSIMSDVWYTFTPDFSGPVLWSMCDLVAFDTRLGVYGPDVDCANLVADDLLECNDDGSGCSNYTSQLFFDVEEGRTYLLRFGGFNGATGIGTFDLINQSPPEPPANDMCGSAEEVILETTVGGTTNNAGFNPASFSFPPCLNNTNGGEFAEVWYTFNNEGAEEMEIQLISTNEDASFFVDLWDDCMTQVDTNRVLNNCTNLDPAISTLVRDTFGLLADVPTQYHLRVVTRLTGSLPGDFEFALLPIGLETSTFETPDALNGDISLAPNPVEHTLNLEIPLNRKSDLSYSIQNMLGQDVIVNKIGLTPTGIHNQYIDVAALSPGVYVINILVNNQPIGVKFIKQ